MKFDFLFYEVFFPSSTLEIDLVMQGLFSAEVSIMNNTGVAL